VSVFANASLPNDVPNYMDFDANQVRYSAGVRLDNLVDKLPARNAYRTSLVNFEAQLRNLIANLDNLRDRIDRGFRMLESQRQNYLNRKAALAVAELRVDMNLKLLDASRALVRDVREAQDDLIGAQNQLTDSVVLYLDSRMQLLYEIGVLKTSIDRFWLKDPLAAQDAKLATPPSLTAPAEELLLPNQVLEPTP
jgi:hypothetical protein